ncbi:DUF418 domain-containing protein [Paenibacillus oryzae]|nr:DUF418 domain-containing protein [Paenibacillus oryzae]
MMNEMKTTGAVAANGGGGLLTDNEAKSGSRVTLVDAIRGFCLFGILQANMLIFQYGLIGTEFFALFQATALDQKAYNWLEVLVAGSFLPIFMFLYGYSLVKLRNGLLAKGRKPWRSLVRRFVLLLMIGGLHSYFFWDGDILFLYGLISFGLLLFIRCKPRTLFIWATSMMLLLGGLDLLGNLIESPDDQPKEDRLKQEEYVKRSIPVFQTGSYNEIVQFRDKEDPLDMDDFELAAVAILSPVMLLPMFLFGMAAAGTALFRHPQRERRKYLLWGLVFGSIGGALKFFSVFSIFGVKLAGSSIIGGPMLAMGYLFLAALLLSSLRPASIVLRAFQAVGKLSMSNYLMQTFICTTLFYGYGFGWFGKLGVVPGILLGLLIYALLAAASDLWLRKLPFAGPFEYILRAGTYWSISGKMKPKEIVKQETPPNLLF